MRKFQVRLGSFYKLFNALSLTSPHTFQMPGALLLVPIVKHMTKTTTSRCWGSKLKYLEQLSHTQVISLLQKQSHLKTILYSPVKRGKKWTHPLLCFLLFKNSNLGPCGVRGSLQQPCWVQRMWELGESSEIPCLVHASRSSSQEAKTQKGNTTCQTPHREPWPIWNLSPHHSPYFWCLRPVRPRHRSAVGCVYDAWTQGMRPALRPCAHHSTALSPSFLIHRKGKVTASNSYTLLKLMLLKLR